MMTQNAILLGAKRSQGVMDNGNAYDSTKIYVQMPMKSGADTAGFSASEFNWGDSTNFAKVKDLKFPCQIDLTLEPQTNGKTVSLVVIDVKPISK